MIVYTKGRNRYRTARVSDGVGYVFTSSSAIWVGSSRAMMDRESPGADLAESVHHLGKACYLTFVNNTLAMLTASYCPSPAFCFPLHTTQLATDVSLIFEHFCQRSFLWKPHPRSLRHTWAHLAPAATHNLQLTTGTSHSLLCVRNAAANPSALCT